MNFIKIITGFIVLWFFTFTSLAQEIDYAGLKYRDTLSNGLICSGVSQIGNSSLKRVGLVSTLEYRPDTAIVKTIIIDGETIKEFNDWVCVALNDDYIIVSHREGNIYIYNRAWAPTASFNINHIVLLEDFSVDHLCPLITKNNLFSFYFGRHIVFVNPLGELVFKYDNAFGGDMSIEDIQHMRIFEINDTELVVDLWGYGDTREVYHIDLRRKIITNGPDIDKIAKENKLGITRTLYFSAVSGYLYVNCQGKFFITDWNQSFLTISNDKLIYDFSRYNPIYIENSNKVLLYSPRRSPDEFHVFDIDKGSVVENIKFNEFFSETNEKIDRITFIAEAIEGYTIAGLVSTSAGEKEQVVLRSETKPDAENYREMKISQVAKFDITENIKLD